MKTEDSPVERSRTYSGSFSDSRETLSRMSSQSNPTRSEAAEGRILYFRSRSFFKFFKLSKFSNEDGSKETLSFI